MSELSLFRLYLLRGGYLLIGVGLTLMIIPGVIDPPPDLPHMNSVVRSLLAAVALLSFLGIRYPLKLLPVLFFELIWKTVWVFAFGLRFWSAGRLDADISQSLSECIFGIIVVLIVVPWGYVYKNYIRSPGERWTRSPAE